MLFIENQNQKKVSFISNKDIDIQELREAIDNMSGRAYIRDLAKKSRNGTLSDEEKKTIDFIQKRERYGKKQIEPLFQIWKKTKKGKTKWTINMK